MKELKVAATVENLKKVNEFIHEDLKKLECSMQEQFQIDLCVEEIFVNIASYAYGQEEGEAVIQSEISKEPKKIVITMIDRGMPYDPLQKEDPDITLSAEERGIGGLGIFLTKITMDNIRYEYKDSQNILTMEKNIK